VKSKFGLLLCLFFLTIVSYAETKPPERIISCMPSVTEMLFALNLSNEVVGVTTNCNFPPEAKKKEKIGGFTLNLEKIVSLKPDLVVMIAGAQNKEIKRFQDYGLPVYTLEPLTVNAVMEDLLKLGQLTGHERSARRVVGEMESRIKAVERRTSRFRPGLGQVLELWSAKSGQRKALVIVGYNPLIVAGGGTFIDDIVNHAGVINFAGQAKAAYPHYSFEQLINENPPYIIIPRGLVGERTIKNDERWQSLEAVRNDRVLFIDPDILSRPGPRVALAIEQISDFIYK